MKDPYEEGIFEADAGVGKKFFLTFPYPYMNGFLHLGHLYSMMKVEVLARYKRLTGHNVLFPFGFHTTGMPIVAAAQRIAEGEEKQIAILRMMGIPEKEIPKFKDPEYWTEYFPEETKKDLKSLGMSIDFRRSFKTAPNPTYSRFIEWQFRKLKQMGYVQTGKHPVVWCPKDKTVVGDHARMEGEGVMPEKIVIIKFRMDGKVLPAATLRPETVFGVTNLWLKEGEEYSIIRVGSEEWIASPEMLGKLQDQGIEAEEISRIRAEELFGKKALNPATGKEVPILPAKFVKMDVMTGVVMSVPMHAPYDYQALKDLEGTEWEGTAKSVEMVKVIEAGITAPEAVEKAGIRDQEDEKLEELTKEIYKKEYHTGRIVVGKFEGQLVRDAKPRIVEWMKEEGFGDEIYDLLERVVCRCLTRCRVKIVENQWFLKYSDPQWKELARRALAKLRLYPEKARKQFEHVVEWLSDWACARKFGLGTTLPWDREWVIESLSDSTIYMAYYTISHLLDGLEAEPEDDLFDYVFLGKGDEEEILRKYGEAAKKMREEFEYWYPLDFRNSGKDLIQNHLTMMLFNHVAIFPEEKWPRGIGVNGHVLVDGLKMSKSKGNFFTIRELVREFGPDATRLAAAYAGEGMDDANFETSLARTLKSRIEEVKKMCEEALKGSRREEMLIDKWFRNRAKRAFLDAASHLENVETRSAAQRLFFDLLSDFKWYMRRAEPNRGLMEWFVKNWMIALSVFIPFTAEEVWQKHWQGWACQQSWPIEDVENFPDTERFLKDLIDDLRHTLMLAKRKGAEGRKAVIHVAEGWKFEALQLIREGKVREAVERYPALKEGKVLQRLMKEKVAEPLEREMQISLLNEAREFLEKETGLEIEVRTDGQGEKAKVSTPAKPGIEII